MSTELSIDTERLVLRPLKRGDIEDFLSYYALPDVQRYLDWKVRDSIEAKTAFEAMRKHTRLTRPGDIVTLAIERKADGAVMGHISLRWTDATAAQAEMRFALGPAYRGQGYASEAARVMLDHAFECYRLHRVFAVTSGHNERAARMLRSLGMRLEAHYREHALFMGEWDEELHFAILDREWLRGAKVREISRNKVA
jgi:RimJ/RimL family protein N-acetyltransferase